jgi:hypothetical protein
MIVSAEAAANAIWVRAIGTTRRLQALVTIGHSQAYLCERLLIPPKSRSPIHTSPADGRPSLKVIANRSQCWRFHPKNEGVADGRLR